jgi:hypothetical protein
MSSRELAEHRELAGRLENVLVEVADTQLLRQAVRIALVALGASALRDAGHHEFVDMRAQRLVEPGTLKSFFHDQMLVPGDHANRFDQGLAVRLDREVLELPALL